MLTLNSMLKKGLGIMIQKEIIFNTRNFKSGFLIQIELPEA